MNACQFPSHDPESIIDRKTGVSGLQFIRLSLRETSY